jgi:hypothetical protein
MACDFDIFCLPSGLGPAAYLYNDSKRLSIVPAGRVLSSGGVSLRNIKEYFSPYLWNLRRTLWAAVKLGEDKLRKVDPMEANQMQNFVIVGKAKTVFRLIELKAKQEAAARQAGKAGPGDRK